MWVAMTTSVDVSEDSHHYSVEIVYWVFKAYDRWSNHSPLVVSHSVIEKGGVKIDLTLNRTDLDFIENTSHEPRGRKKGNGL